MREGGILTAPLKGPWIESSDPNKLVHLETGSTLHRDPQGFAILSVAGGPQARVVAYEGSKLLEGYDEMKQAKKNHGKLLELKN